MALTVGAWYALGAFATLLTLVYLVVLPNERVYMTAGLSGFAWSVMALTARNLTQYTDSGSSIAVEFPELQYFVGGLAFLSYFTVLLYHFGEYPPTSAEPTTNA